jgi:hypothetical protein
MVRPPRTTIQTWFPRLGLGHKSQMIVEGCLQAFLLCCGRCGVGPEVMGPIDAFQQVSSVSMSMPLSAGGMQETVRYGGSEGIRGLEYRGFEPHPRSGRASFSCSSMALFCLNFEQVAGPMGFEPIKIVGSMRIPLRLTILSAAVLELPNVDGPDGYDPSILRCLPAYRNRFSRLLACITIVSLNRHKSHCFYSLPVI